MSRIANVAIFHAEADRTRVTKRGCRAFRIFQPFLRDRRHAVGTHVGTVLFGMCESAVDARLAAVWSFSAGSSCPDTPADLLQSTPQVAIGLPGSHHLVLAPPKSAVVMLLGLYPTFQQVALLTAGGGDLPAFRGITGLDLSTEVFW